MGAGGSGAAPSTPSAPAPPPPPCSSPAAAVPAAEAAAAAPFALAFLVGRFGCLARLVPLSSPPPPSPAAAAEVPIPIPTLAKLASLREMAAAVLTASSSCNWPMRWMRVSSRAVVGKV